MPKHDSLIGDKTPANDTKSSPCTTTQNEDKPTGLESNHYEWLELGQGSYNRVWVSAKPDETGYYRVLKYPLPSEEKIINDINQNTRGVRLWNEINPSSHTGLPDAALYQSAGWTAPYITNARQATDKEAAIKVLEIYQETRRIVVDAATSGNILTCIDDSQQAILVDVDLALNLRDSVASLNFAKSLYERFNNYWHDPVLNKTMPLTLTITQNLLYLEKNLSSNDIDLLRDEHRLTLENLLTLSWLRERNEPLSILLFMEVITLCDAGIEISDVLFESLLSSTQKTVDPKNTKHSHQFFTPEIQSNESRVTYSKLSL